MNKLRHSFESDKLQRTGRETMIAAMGLIAFNLEAGPNAHSPEVETEITVSPEAEIEIVEDPTEA